MANNLKIKEIKYNIEPHALSLIVTNECTAACTDCCFNCSPKKGISMTVDEAKQYIKDGIDVFKTIKLAVLTGGEPFLLGIDSLVEIIEYINEFKIYSRIVSNAFWATTPEKTANYVERLAKAGLHEINFSTGDEHQKFVKVKNVVNACIESVKVGLMVAVNIESHAESNFSNKNLIEDERYKEFFSKQENSDKIRILNGLWSSLDNKDKPYKYAENYLDLLKDNRRGCDSIFDVFSIFPNGDMTACCGLTVSKIKHLQLGNVKQESVKTLWESQYKYFINLWLKIEGPYKILEYLSTKEPEIKNLRLDHTCQACNYLFNNQMVVDTVSKYYVEKIPEVLFKYQIQKKLKNI